jgi:hypothetical protein
MIDMLQLLLHTKKKPTIRNEKTFQAKPSIDQSVLMNDKFSDKGNIVLPKKRVGKGFKKENTEPYRYCFVFLNELFFSILVFL